MSDPSSVLLNCRLDTLDLLPFRVNAMHLSPQSDPVLSRQVKTVLPPVGLRVPVFRPVLSTSAPVFCPRADRLPPTGTT